MSSTDFKDLQKNWDMFGKVDPLWAILTDPTKKNNQWDIDEFFKTGEKNISDLMEEAGHIGLPRSREMALDFGCGVGRLTQALCKYYTKVIGIDVAPSMIELARKYNRFDGRCEYILNETPDLSIFKSNSFDFIVTLIVLQHMKPVYSKAYIREFLRVLAPGGLLIFQIPSHIANLPDHAFRAELNIDHHGLIAEAGSRITIGLRIKNISDITWPAGVLNLGNHWYSDNNIFKWDDMRVNLVNELKPGEEMRISFTANVPDMPGNYRLEFDLVQENVAWFQSKGSKSAAIDVMVIEPSKNNQRQNSRQVDKCHQVASEDSTAPIMEVYTVSKEEVLDLINKNGGRVVLLKRDNWSGPSWVSFTYWVTK